MKKILFIEFFTALGLIAALLFAYLNIQHFSEDEISDNSRNELSQILDNKELNVVVDYNSANYFIYKGYPTGFQYELLKQFSEDYGFELKLHVSKDIQQSVTGLLEGEYDLIAKNLLITSHRTRQIEFTEPWGITRQVLVQRSPDGRMEQKISNFQGYISDHIDLGKKTLVVSNNSAYIERIKSLSDEIGEAIHIIEDSANTTEQLIAMVAAGEIDYTICDENIGKVMKKFFPGIDLSIPVSFNQKFAWAVRKDALFWKNFIDEWIVGFKQTARFRALYNKYFSDGYPLHFAMNAYNTILGGRISDYDRLIREIASYYEWDWRLIAAIVMQESGFDPEASSWMGAAGLMQLMPQTAERYNVDDVMEPRENVRGGIEYLTWIDELFQPIVPDTDERIKFVLASYNVGIGHVMDARRLAMKYDHDPSVWDGHVEYFLMNKSVARYYSDPLVKWGYCRGEETVSFVDRIIERYRHYQNTLPADQHVVLAAN